MLGKALQNVRRLFPDRAPPPTRPQPWSPLGTSPSSRDRIFKIDPSTRQQLCPSDTSARTSLSGYPDSPTTVPPGLGDGTLAVVSAARSGQYPPLLAEQRPCLFAGVVTVDDTSFTTKIKIQSGLAAMQLEYVALSDKGSAQTFIKTHAFDSVKRVGAASATCERYIPPRSWGGFGMSPSLETSVTAVRLSVQFFDGDKPTASLAVWAYVVLSEAMQHDVLLGRDSWMQFQDRSYRTLAPCSITNRVLGELTLPLLRLQGATAFVPDSWAHPESFHLLAGDNGNSISRDHRLVDIDLVRSNGVPALAGCYLLNMLLAATDFSAEERIVENGRLIPLAGAADLDPGALLDTSSSPLRRVSLVAVLSDASAPS